MTTQANAPTQITVPLVGMHFRPPAKEVVAALPIGTRLELRPEPTNQYDPNAVMVLVDMSIDFPVQRIELLQTLLPHPYDACILCASGPLHLGYLAATGAKTARGGHGNASALMLMSQGACDARLGTAPEGYPVVVITRKE